MIEPNKAETGLQMFTDKGLSDFHNWFFGFDRQYFYDHIADNVDNEAELDDAIVRFQQREAKSKE